ncbi:MAG: ribonuclease Z [Thermoplasmata archaeon]|nr:ribonuclease Z [Thermoplasmata archaeon]
MKLVFLGTGGGWPSKEAGVSAIALGLPKRAFLFDCGEGTQRQLMFSSISFMSISHIFLTHYHGDHFLGLPGLIQSMSLNDRTDKLTIVGPGNIQRLVESLLSLGYFNLTFPVETLEAIPGEELKLGNIGVTPFANDHTVPGVGYVVEEQLRPGRFDKKAALRLGVPEGPLFARLQRGESVEVKGSKIGPEGIVGPPRPGRKVVLTGDTRPLAPPDSWEGCDVLVHDATFSDEMEERSGRYGHSTAKQAAVAAKSIGARMLCLVHRSPRYKDTNVLLEEAVEVFPESRLPMDLDEIDVPFRDQTTPS